MSIIHDALKKVQLNLENQPPDMSKQPGSPIVPKPWEPAPAAADSPSASQITDVSKPETEKPKKSKRVWLLTAVLLILAVAAGTIYSTDESMEKIGEWAHDQKWRIKHFFAAQKIKPLPAFPNLAPAPNGPAALNLQGIVVNNGATVALINNKIYEAGEEVNGAKIISIGENSVTVSRDEKMEILKLRR